MMSLMRHKTPELELEFSGLHPLIRDLILDLDAYSRANGLPEVVITECLRTPEDQERLYWKQLKRDLNISEDAARRQAKQKFSWHLCAAAIDIRTSHYTPRQYETVKAHLQLAMAKVSKRPGFWEFLPDKHGTGAHCHIARKDAKFRDDYLRPTAKSPLNINPGITTHKKDPSA